MMSHEPWLDSLSDDWPEVPDSPTTPATPAPSKPTVLPSSPRLSAQNSPSRIPVPARRSAEQQSQSQSPADGKKKVTRPCHFIKREPPTPKTPRTPRTPAKLRSPTPKKTKSTTPKPSPKRSPKPKPKPTPGAAGKQAPTMDTRSPLRSVSNVSSQSGYQSTNTVQIKPQKSRDEGAATPEWRKRLVRGEIGAGEQRDLFAPMGLESVFKPPTPGSATGQQDSIPFAKQGDQLWDFTDATSRQDSAMRGDGDGEDTRGQESERAHGEYSGAETESPMGTVNRAPRGDKQPREQGFDQEGYSAQRSVSGLEDLRNEGITPITFTRPNTLQGGATSEVIKSALKQVTNKLESLSMDTGNRPDSPASDSFLFYNNYTNNEPHHDGSPQDDSLLDVTSHSLPQDLSMGTVDFSRRGNRSFRHRFSPSPFPSHRMSPATLANAKIRSSPLFNPAQNNGSPTLPRPSSSHVRPSTAGDATTKENKMPSSGSPLKLFGEHDTFTNNRLLRRMSQFEETFGDGSDGDEPPSPSEEARRKGESRSFLNVRHEPLSEISSRLNQRLASRNANRPRLTRFGDGELDKFDFSDTSPYEHKLVYDETNGFGSRPSSRKRSAGRQQYLRRPSQQGSLRYAKTARSASSSFTRKPSAWARQSYFDHARDTSLSSRLKQKENQGFSEIKRVPKAAPDPTPKRRRTILRDDSAEPDHPHIHGDGPSKYGDSMSLLQRSLLQHGVHMENGDYLAPPGVSHSMQRPRTPTPSQIRTAHESNILPSRDYSESTFDERDYSDSFSIEGDIPLVKVTGTSDSSRKGSITTQDYLNEATKIMDLIRSKGHPAAGLTSVQESDAGSEEEFSYDDESTREAFSRPPSREGTDLRKQREPKELNPQILNHLKKYAEKDDGDIGANDSVMSFSNPSANTRPRVASQHRHENGRLQALVPDQRKRKNSDSGGDVAENIAHDLMTINTQMSGFSVHSVPTGSSQNSQAKGMLSSDLVAHLIPKQVNGLVFDRSRNAWVKGDAEEPALQPSQDDENDDPFHDIPDLSVDELQEMMRVHGLSSPAKSLSAEEQADHHARSPLPSGNSPRKVDPRPHTRDGEPSVSSSSVQSKATRFTSSVPNTGTRATSWGTDDNQDRNGTGLAPFQDGSASGSQSCAKQARVATITFSSPLVSQVVYRDNSDVPESHHKNAGPNYGASDHASEQHGSSRTFAPHISREASVAGQPFIRRPISRIEERNEEGADELSLVRREDSLAVQQTPSGNAAEHSLVPLQTPEQTNYSFHMSPLPEFSVNLPDHPLNLEMSYVAQRIHPTSLRQVHGTFALATEDLIKHITDVEPYEPYWDHVRRLVLRQKGLITLHKLSDFCPRLEDLDVSDNDIGQLSGVPSSLRTLKIPRNCLSNLTPWSHLTNLQYLDISGNDIETLDGFSSLIHLRELKANDNQIRNIDGILDMNGLLSLKLSNNSVTTVDFEGAELTRLRDLDLSHNCLTSVRNVEWLPSLVTLDLSANQITRFESAGSLISLRALRLSGNRLESFDVKNFSSVSLLYLDQNCLSTVGGLDRCHNLEVLSIREQTSSGQNPGFALDLNLALVKDIRKLFLSSNKLARGCLSPSAPLLQLQLLDVASCTLDALPQGFASSFPNLKVLNLNFNSISELEPLVGMNCLSRLSIVSNRLARMRRICQILSRLGRTGRGSQCSLRKLDIRGNPLTVGFYPPALTGSGNISDRKQLKNQDQTASRKQGSRQELSDALADLGHNDHLDRAVTWEDGAKPDREPKIDDPFTVPPADAQADAKYLSRLDQATRLRRRVLELLLYAGTGGSLHTMDGLELRPSLGSDSSDMSKAWARLEELGVLRRKAITRGP